MHKIDLLSKRISEMKNPTVAGLDTRLEHLPKEFVEKTLGGAAETLESASKAILEFNKRLVDALCGIVPAVKVQIAYYEMYGLAGMECFAETVLYAKKKGMLVITDAKRNDIGATAEAYSAAHIGETAVGNAFFRAFFSDFVTVTPYLGEDGINPFIKDAEKTGNGIFVLVKTSNPSGCQLQNLIADGKPVYRLMGELVSRLGESTIGESGYSLAGAVVGATYPSEGAELRKALPHTFFLVPGYGAQGATAADIAGCFDKNCGGAVVNASRSLLLAWKKREGVAFDEAARLEALKMRDDIAAGLSAAGKDFA
ncbi:MAG: orotidine-5'-phosphate decarboxylase [Eubacteriales bacterium]|nr:orotidine-5'-phosphate decarboxylase [Eubacteriales bacterium]MDD3883203.1 orotidine-5'-phosphate decarboxylase [Eubacteriales bacterium]MDD4512721.1 orotidine-5'-phosphate decarboxylase [Eubacteriales bacterium]